MAGWGGQSLPCSCSARRKIKPWAGRRKSGFCDLGALRSVDAAHAGRLQALFSQTSRTPHGASRAQDAPKGLVNCCIVGKSLGNIGLKKHDVCAFTVSLGIFTSDAAFYCGKIVVGT